MLNFYDVLPFRGYVVAVGLLAGNTDASTPSLSSHV